MGVPYHPNVITCPEWLFNWTEHELEGLHPYNQSFTKHMHHTLSFLLSLPSSSLCWATCPLFPRTSTTPEASWAETMSSPSLLYLRAWHCVAHKAPTKHLWSQKINENKPVSNLGWFRGKHCLVPKFDPCSFVSNTFMYAICHGTEETWWCSQGSRGERGQRQGHFPSTYV